MDTAVILECKKLSLEGKITFPEVVKRLLQAGVELYHVDLIKQRATYYGEQKQTLDTDFSLSQLPVVSDVFDAQAVAQSVKRSQKREIDYVTFITEVMKAGTYAYTAYLKGKRVAYLGKMGEMHIEHFPQAPSQP